MVETRKYRCLAKELFACLLNKLSWEGAVVFNFLDRAQPTLQACIICKINAACAALSNQFTDLIAATQYLPFL
jgi:hypothetical protein